MVVQCYGVHYAERRWPRFVTDGAMSAAVDGSLRRRGLAAASRSPSPAVHQRQQFANDHQEHAARRGPGPPAPSPRCSCRRTTRKFAAVTVVCICAVVLLAEYLQTRDDAVLLRFPRPPVPAHGRMVTIKLHEETIAKIARNASLPEAAFARSFDMYYEADLSNGSCDPSKNFVVLSGTNGQSFLYWPLLEHFKAQGYCTLVFDYRSHGRSEVAPGAYTAELFGEDAATIIRQVFGDGQRVHLFGWSLGGALAYYLALEHPDMVASLTVLGMTSCFGRRVLPPYEGGARDDSWSSMFIRPFSIEGIAARPLFHWQSLLRLQGTELLGWFASQPVLFNHLTTPEVMRYHYSLRTEALSRTFQTWPRWNYRYYHDALRQIKQPQAPPESH